MREKIIKSKLTTKSKEEISERKNAEERLLSEIAFRKSIELSINSGIALVDKEGCQTYVNPSFCKLMGWTAEELTGKIAPFVYWPPDQMQAIGEAFEITLADKAPKEGFELEFIRKDGVRIPVQIKISPFIEGEEITGWLANVNDITDRKRQESINKARVRLLEFAVKNTLDKLLEETLNEAEILSGSLIGFYHFLEADQKTLYLQNWSTRTKRDFCSADGKCSHYALDIAGVWVDCVRERKPIIHNDYESLSYKKGLPKGHVEIIRELTVPVIRNGKIMAIIGVGNKQTDYDKKDLELVSMLADLAWDIAERKIVEEELQKSEENLRRLNAVKDKFFSIIAHDLRAPFTGFLGLTELMVTDIRKLSITDLQKIGTQLNISAYNLYGLLTNLLEWSKMQRGLTDFNPEKISFNKIIKDNIDVKISAAYYVCDTADKPMLDTVIRNLVSNAIKFTKKGGSVTISSNRLADRVEIAIIDKGIGMNKELIIDLFKLDKQTGRKGTENEPSSGLGLLLCKEFIEKHGGKICVESEEEKGSKFSFWLPAAQ